MFLQHARVLFEQIKNMAVKKGVFGVFLRCHKED
jgi:hypothetical protein